MSFTLSEVLTLVLPALAVILIIVGLVYGGSARRGKRYRPGRPFEFRPVWFVSASGQLAGDTTAAALPPAPAETETRVRQTGGASDRW